MTLYTTILIANYHTLPSIVPCRVAFESFLKLGMMAVFEIRSRL